MRSQKCAECDEPVTNPICLSCLKTEVLGWMKEKKKSLVPLVKSRADFFRNYPETGVKCIICGENMNICSHCFTNDILICLREDHPNLADDFKRSFNFGHIQSMENKGIG